VFNAIQLFGFVLLGGLASGEAARRLAGLPRTTGYVVFGLLAGQSGIGWISAEHIEDAQLFIDLALGLILFELGYLVPRTNSAVGHGRLQLGFAIAALTGLALWLLFYGWGYETSTAYFAAALCLATSPAITIATCSDVGAKGERTGLLYTLVAVTGAIAFASVVLVTPFFSDTYTMGILGHIVAAVGSIVGAILLGGACAGIVLLGAELLERQPEHQHLLILGSIVLGVGTAIYLEISVFLPMLIFGILVSAIDREHKVIAIRIASDARVFLVITFVLAGAALDITHLTTHWPAALTIAAVRLAGQFAGTLFAGRALELGMREKIFITIGLQPMSSISLVLLVNMQMLNIGTSSELAEMLMATILLMQLLGPLATQTAIKGFGEATRLSPTNPAARPHPENGD
jgi:Kef-type K+ transport system membrane component KefB